MGGFGSRTNQNGEIPRQDPNSLENRTKTVVIDKAMAGSSSSSQLGHGSSSSSLKGAAPTPATTQAPQASPFVPAGAPHRSLHVGNRAALGGVDCVAYPSLGRGDPMSGGHAAGEEDAEEEAMQRAIAASLRSQKSRAPAHPSQAAAAVESAVANVGATVAAAATANISGNVVCANPEASIQFVREAPVAARGCCCPAISNGALDSRQDAVASSSRMMPPPAGRGARSGEGAPGLRINRVPPGAATLGLPGGCAWVDNSDFQGHAPDALPSASAGRGRSASHGAARSGMGDAGSLRSGIVSLPRIAPQLPSAVSQEMVKDLHDSYKDTTLPSPRTNGVHPRANAATSVSRVRQTLNDDLDSPLNQNDECFNERFHSCGNGAAGNARDGAVRRGPASTATGAGGRTNPISLARRFDHGAEY